MKKIKVLALLAATAMFMSCVSTGGSDNDPAVNKGVNAWNSKGPAAAEAYWVEIKDAEKQKKYLNGLQTVVMPDNNHVAISCVGFGHPYNAIKSSHDRVVGLCLDVHARMVPASASVG